MTKRKLLAVGAATVMLSACGALDLGADDAEPDNDQQLEQAQAGSDGADDDDGAAQDGAGDDDSSAGGHDDELRERARDLLEEQGVDYTEEELDEIVASLDVDAEYLADRDLAVAASSLSVDGEELAVTRVDCNDETEIWGLAAYLDEDGGLLQVWAPSDPETVFEEAYIQSLSIGADSYNETVDGSFTAAESGSTGSVTLSPRDGVGDSIHLEFDVACP